jgi:hypothetical protein
MRLQQNRIKDTTNSALDVLMTERRSNNIAAFDRV